MINSFREINNENIIMTRKGIDYLVNTDIIVALIAFLGTLCGSTGGILVANRLVNYRIEQLEKKVESHNKVVERVALLERDEKTIFKRLDEHSAAISVIQKEI